MRTTATNHHRRVAAIGLVGVALALGAAATTNASSPPTEERIPDGTYTRVATVEDGIALGLDPQFAEEMTGPDGESPFRIVFDGDRWLQYGTSDLGIEELGSQGNVDYDAEARPKRSDRGPERRGARSAHCRGPPDQERADSPPTLSALLRPRRPDARRPRTPAPAWAMSTADCPPRWHQPARRAATGAERQHRQDHTLARAQRRSSVNEHRTEHRHTHGAIIKSRSEAVNRTHTEPIPVSTQGHTGSETRSLGSWQIG